MKKYIWTSLVLILHFNLIGQSSLGQEEEIRTINLFEVAMSYAQPRSGFNERYGKDLYGFEANYLIQLRPSQPILGFAKFDYYPMERYEVIDQNGASDKTSSHLIGLELGARYYLPVKIGAIEFCGELGLGLNNLYTTNSLTQDGENILTNKLLGDSALKYTSGLGMNIKAGYGYVFVKSSLQNGISARYMVKQNPISTSIPTSDLAFDQTKSSIDVIKWDIGYTFVF